MSYNTKNYTEQGGDKTVIGGELEIKEGARVTGLPSSAENQRTSEANTVAALRDDFNALLAKLKNAGIVTPDAWTFTTRIAPNVSGAGGRNNAKATASIDGTVITVTADVNDLEEYDSSNPEQGVHKWIGLGVGTGLSSLTKMTYNGYAATQADVNEATGVGLDQPGEFVLWIKADEVAVTPKTAVLGADGYRETEITVILKAPVEG
jgi:hypothetical protein